MKFTSLLIFVSCIGAALGILANETNKKLLLPDKLGLFALSTLQPSKFPDISWNSVFAEEELPYIDYFFIDVRTLLTQSLKFGEQTPLPEYSWSNTELWCLPFCSYHSFDLKTGNTTITGQEKTTSVNEITPNSLRNLFTAPSLIWESVTFAFETWVNWNYNERWSWKNLRLSLSNLKLDTTFDYEFIQELGIQIRNLEIKFSLGHLRTTLWDVKHYDGAFYTPYPPLFTDWTLYLLSDWVNLKGEYQDSLEFRINCVLSDARNDPERCADYTFNSTVTGTYQKMNVIQLFETIGLTSLESTQ